MIIATMNPQSRINGQCSRIFSDFFRSKYVSHMIAGGAIKNHMIRRGLKLFWIFIIGRQSIHLKLKKKSSIQWPTIILSLKKRQTAFLTQINFIWTLKSYHRVNSRTIANIDNLQNPLLTMQCVAKLCNKGMNVREGERHDSSDFVAYLRLRDAAINKKVEVVQKEPRTLE